MRQAHALAVRQQFAAVQAQALAGLAHRKDRLACLNRGRGEGPKGVRVGIEHGGPAPGQQGLEQPQLGRLVAGHVPVIVQMILGQVQEPRGLQSDPIQPTLVDPVGRGFQRQVGYPQTRELGQQLGHIARIRGGQTWGRQLLIQVRT